MKFPPTTISQAHPLIPHPSSPNPPPLGPAPMPSIIDLEITFHPSGFADVTAKSSFTGRTHTRTMVLDKASFEAWHSHGTHIQNALPDLSPDDREFLLTGATPQEWNEAFGPEEESDRFDPAFGADTFPHTFPSEDIETLVEDLDAVIASVLALAPIPPVVPLPCANHPNIPAVTNLDGDNLCLACANEWVRNEGQSSDPDDR